jgi:superfamily II DNA/RNA helicase
LKRQGFYSTYDKSEVLPPSRTPTYRESSITANRSQEEVDAYYKTHQITIDGNPQRKPILSFDDETFGADIVARLAARYNSPTPIQSVAWPVALSGQSLIGIAQTGSGKTLGFILPAVIRELDDVKKTKFTGPRALILCPTRELALQIHHEARTICDPLNIGHAVCYGGAGRAPQQDQLHAGPSVVVGTPGRLLDFTRSGDLDLRACHYLVLDEADRMLDMGFEHQIRSILSQMRQDRQTLLWSATWPKEVRSLAAEFLPDNHTFINIGSLQLAANPNIRQHVHLVEPYMRKQKLFDILDGCFDRANSDSKKSRGKVIVFTQTKASAEFLGRAIANQRRHNVAFYHGDVTQSRREMTLSMFRKNQVDVLVATDVASRGLDISDVTDVINYEFPMDAEQYIHRIGRTGRVDRKGTSHTILTEADGKNADFLIKVLKESKQPVSSELESLARLYRETPRKDRIAPAQPNHFSGGRRRYGNQYGGGRGYGSHQFRGPHRFSEPQSFRPSDGPQGERWG